MVYYCLKGDVPISLKPIQNQCRLWQSKIKCINEINNTICKNKTVAYKAFSVAGPRLWNSLPHKIRDINHLIELKSLLKHAYPLGFIVIMIITSITNNYINCKVCLILYIQ